MNELQLSLPTAPVLKGSTVPAEMFKEEFADILLKAGLEELKTISFSDFENVSENNGYSLALSHRFLGFCITAYAKQNDLIIHNGLIKNRTNYDLASTDVMFASRTTPTVYIKIKAGEELDQLIACFTLKASDLFETIIIPMVQFDSIHCHSDVSMRISRTIFSVDCFDLVPEGYLDQLQDKYVEYALKNLKHASTSSYEDISYEECVRSIRKLQVLKDDLKELNADQQTYLDFGMIASMSGYIPTILNTLTTREVVLRKKRELKEEHESTLTYRYYREWSKNTNNMVFMHIVTILLLAIFFVTLSHSTIFN